MKITLFISVFAFAIGSIFDLLTTILGVADILGGNAIAWVLSIAVTFVVIALNFQIKDAWLNKQWWILPFSVLAIVFDFYTSMTGEQYLPPEVQGVIIKSFVGWITLAFIAFFFVASPVFLFESLKKF